MHWQELLIGKPARVTQLGLAYDCPLHVSTHGTLHGIDIDVYAPVYFCTVCHRAFSAREMAGLLNVRSEIPQEEPVTCWLWRVRDSNPTPYWNDEPIRHPLARHAVGARDLLHAIDSLTAPLEKRQRIAHLLRGASRGAVVFVHTAGYDGVATSLTLARPTAVATWPSLALDTGVTGFIPSVTADAPVVFVPTVEMVLVPPIDLADVGIAGAPRFTHADGDMSLAADWRGASACTLKRVAVAGRRAPGTVAVVGRVVKRYRRKPVLNNMIAWMCAVAVAKSLGMPIRLRITLPKRVADILVDHFGWYQDMAKQLDISILRDRYTRLAVTIAAQHDTTSRELHLDLGSTLLKNVSLTVWPPQSQKLLKAIRSAVSYVREKAPELLTLLQSDSGGFLLGLVNSLASDPRRTNRIRYKLTVHDREALRAVSTTQTEPLKEIPCAS